MVFDGERNLVDTFAAKGKDFRRTVGMDFPHQETRFRNDRLTTAEWRQVFPEQP
jgi:hypothetical protein